MTLKHGLTPRQRDVLDAIKGYIEEHGCSPSRRELAEICDLAPGSIQRHIEQLTYRGWLTSAPGRARSLALVDD